MALKFKEQFDPAYGSAVSLSPLVSRVTAPNGGPFTYKGTNTYLIGTETLAILDPGPIIEEHLKTIDEAVAGRPVSHIIVTHTHMDHSPSATQLANKYGAKIYAEGEHRAARDLFIGEVNPLDASSDKDFKPDLILKDGEIVEGDGWSLETVFTPGHTANHTAFSLREENTLFSGDHVMAWSTSIVAPPDGSMEEFMQSLETLMTRDEHVYYPGHGGRVENPNAFVRGLKNHRLMREAAILERLKKGDRTIREIVAVLYRDVNPKLHGAAALSVLAHLEDLVSRQQARCETVPSIKAIFMPA